MSMPGPPHIEPPRCPGQTSHSPGSASSLSCSEWKIPRAPCTFSTARSGRAMSPTNSVSPLRTAHGSGPRRVSMIANAVCSGRCPGVCSARTVTVPSSSSPAVVEGLVVVVGRGEPVDVDRRAGRGREPAVARDVVGVVVGLEDVSDRHAHVASQRQVLVDLELWIDDRRDCRRARRRPCRTHIRDRRE